MKCADWTSAFSEPKSVSITYIVLRESGQSAIEIETETRGGKSEFSKPLFH